MKEVITRHKILIFGCSQPESSQQWSQYILLSKSMTIMHYKSTTRKYEIHRQTPTQLKTGIEIVTPNRNCAGYESIRTQLHIVTLAKGQNSYKIRFSYNKLSVQHCTRRFNIEITWYKETYQFPPDPAPRAVIGVHFTPIIPVAPDRMSRPILFIANKFFPSWLFESKDC